MPVPPDDRPLLVTADPDLLDDLLRLAAAAGVETQVAHDVVAARTGWSSARFVVLGDDLAGAAASRGLGPRPDVVLVGRNRGDDGVWDVASRLGADSVVFLPAAETWVVDRLADAVEAPAARAVTVGVVGGRGGAGASTLAGALAVTGSATGAACWSTWTRSAGGADLLVGAELAEGLRWPDLASARGRVAGAGLVASLPRADGLRVLSWDRGPACVLPVDAARSVLAAATRTHDLGLLDLPRDVDPVAEMALTGADSVLLLVPAEVRAVAAAARVAAVVGSVASELRVVVRGPAPSGLSAVAEVAGILRLPLAGWLRPEAGLDRLLERGEAPARSGRGPLAELSRELLDALPARGLGSACGMTPEPALVSRVADRLAQAGQSPPARGGVRPAGRGVAGRRAGRPRPRRRGAVRAHWRRPPGRLAGRPGGERRPGQRAVGGLAGPRPRVGAGGGAVPRRGGGPAACPATRGVRGPQAGRRGADRRRPAARRHPFARRDPPGLARGDVDQPAHRSPPRLRPRRPGAAGHSRPASPAPAEARPRPPVLPGHRGHRHRQDDAALHAAVRCRARRAARARRGLRRAPTGSPARRAPRGERAQRRGPGRGRPALLVRQALRTRPDPLVVGEVRGAEVVELLAAQPQHRPRRRVRTVHANTSSALPARIEALALAAGLPRDAAHSQLSAGVDAVVHLARDRSGRRRVAELGCLERGPDGLVRVDVAVRVDETGAPARGLAAARFERLVDGVGVLGRAGVP